MIQDLDSILERRGLDAVVVLGDSTSGNPELLYVAGCRLPRGGVYVKRRGCSPILVVSSLDLGSASGGRVGDVRCYSDYDYEKILASNPRGAYLLLIEKILRDAGVEGRVVVYGRLSASRVVELTDRLRLLGFKVVGESPPTALEEAMEVKDDLEVESLRRVGSKAERVISKTIDLLRGCRVRDGLLIYRGEVLTVGLVKAFVRGLMAEEGLQPIEDFIFSVGPNSADPHYTGGSMDKVRAGEPIVFDLYPQDASGYCFDCTRTLVVGEPSKEVAKMHEVVLEAQSLAFDLMKAGVKAKAVAESVYDLVERRGFKTVRSVVKGDAEARRVGFIHSLGHGVGLTIGERPYLSIYSDDILKAGHVVTVEPGLYDPKVGGVRVEDVVVVRENGPLNLSGLPKDPKI